MRNAKNNIVRFLLIALMIEAVLSSEMLVYFNDTTWRYIPEGCRLQILFWLVKNEEKMPIERHKHRWEDNIKSGSLGNRMIVKCIQVAWNKVRCQEFVF
jgi:hypothetical protein